ncbi:restriction endonuclease [Halobaculum litoreum]|uniref:Restriction endonuclease n=1 Tax=Halobaculum litoreum TaxID=3031998 RepID=A0ABD5XWL0_9EURY
MELPSDASGVGEAPMTEPNAGGDDRRIDDPEALGRLSAETVRELVASTWRSSGWRVDRLEDGSVLLATRGPERTRGPRRRFLRVLAPDRTPTTPTVRRTVELMRRHDADSAAVISVREFGSAAVAVADAHGVDIVGPAELARAVDGRWTAPDR